jgi:hypothetical protein
MNQVSVQVGLASTVLIGPNPGRVALLFGTPRVNRVTVSFKGDATLDRGLPLQPGGNWQMINGDWLGSALTESVTAVAATAPEWITVVEVFR